jgi:hypothetical protein
MFNIINANREAKAHCTESLTACTVYKHGKNKEPRESQSQALF